MLQLLSILIIHSTPLGELAQGLSQPMPVNATRSLDSPQSFQVTRFRFSGNRAITTLQLENLVSNYENGILTEVEVQEIQKRIELLYKSEGYGDIKVKIPKKHKSGVLEIVIQEGKKTNYP